jgi:hypothetical protein
VCAHNTDFSLQLSGLKSAQFAGFYAAQEMGYWIDECLTVTLCVSGLESAAPGYPAHHHHADAAMPDYL